MVASVLLCIGLLAWDRGLVPLGTGRPASVASGQAVAYAAGPRRTDVLLADGSRITLDARSRIAVEMTSGRRDVALLDGQAFFKVAHDRARPFVVAAGGRTVTATGTAFAVSLLARKVTVVLEEGSVNVGSPGATSVRRMIAGQRFVAAGSGDGSVAQVDLEQALAWRSGYVELRDVPIAEAVEQMNRYADRPVLIGDRRAGGLRVTGRFRTDDPVRFVQTLAELYPVRLKRADDGAVTIVSAGGGR